MKKEENKIIIKEDDINCIECIHKEVCEIFNKNKYIVDDWEKIGKEKDCKNFYYKKMDQYLLNDFKKLLKDRINNCENAYHLLIIDSIFKMLNGNDKRIKEECNEKKG